MSRVAYSPAAIADIDSIWDYTADAWGVEQADLYTDRIRDACDELAAGIRLGRPVAIRDGYFKYAVGRHIVFHVRAGNGIAVIRVLHQKMDAERHLSG